MIKFVSEQYKELTFVVNGNSFSFRNGQYTTDHEEVIKVLDASPYTKRAEEEAEVEQTEGKQPKAEAPKKGKAKAKKPEADATAE